MCRCFFHNTQTSFVLNFSHIDLNTDKPIKKVVENEQIKDLGMNQKWPCISFQYLNLGGQTVVGPGVVYPKKRSNNLLILLLPDFPPTYRFRVLKEYQHLYAQLKFGCSISGLKPH